MQKINSIKKLANIASWMTSELRFMLFANVCSSMSFMLVYAVLCVLHVVNRDEFWSIGLAWDLADICDAFLRMWLISHSADLLRSIVIFCLAREIPCHFLLKGSNLWQGRRSYPVIRRLRDSCHISDDKRLKVLRAFKFKMFMLLFVTCR